MTAPATVTNITTGAITDSVVAVGNNNRIVKVDHVEAGAQVNITMTDERPVPRPAPVVVPPRPFDALLGRQKELSDLLSASQSAETVSLWATNGMGKTALVRKLAHSIHQTDASKSIVYLDAQGLGRDDLLRKLYGLFFDFPDSYVPSAATIVSDLQPIQSLVFVDNLSLSGDDVLSFINAAPAFSFVLIAPQRALSGEGEDYPLPGLPDPDAVVLFEKMFGRQLDDAEKEVVTKICDFLKGCPDEIIKAGNRGRDAKKTPVELLSDLRAAGTDDKALATVATADLSEADRKVLAFLAAAGENAVPTAILQLALPGVDVAAELERLKGLNLIQSHSPRYSLCGSLPSGLAAAWDLTPWRDTLLDVSTTWLSQQPPKDTAKDALGMLLHALSDAAARKKWSAVVRLGRLVERYAFSLGRWQAWADVLNLILQAAQAIADRFTQGWALHQLGSRALAQGTLDTARTYLNQALKIREAIKDQPGLDVTRHNLSVLKEIAGPTHGSGSGRSGPGGGNPLTYGFFGFGGLVVVALAVYFLTHRPSAPPQPPLIPPPAITTAAPLPVTGILTETPTSTTTPTDVPTDTPTPTPSPTETVTPQGPLLAIVTVPEKYLTCRYGPGVPYFQRMGLLNGSQVKLIGRADTAFGPWVYVNYVVPFSKDTKGIFCWVNPHYLKVDGDIASLPPYYPDRAPLVLYYHPGVVFPAPTDVAADRTGSYVNIMWTGYVLYAGDRESGTSPRFLVEAWTCINGQFLLYPIGVDADAHVGEEGTLITESALVEDDGGCGRQPYGNVYLAQRDGYVGPAPITPWP